MSDHDSEHRARRGISFVEIYFGAKVLFWLFGAGLSVIILSEMWVSQGHERPWWLLVLEGIFGAILWVVMTVIGWLFPGHDAHIAVRSPNCTVEVVSTDDRGQIIETSRKTVDVKDVSDVSPSNSLWQQVGTPVGLRWTSKASLTEKRALAECKN